MRKIIVSEMISIDGFFADENNGIDWHIVDEEFDEYAVRLLDEADTLLFGRVTYELFEGYWPKVEEDPRTSLIDKKIAQSISQSKKIVYSQTLHSVNWNNVELQKNISLEVINKLKHQSGKDIVIYGSGTIVSQLTNLNVIDEYRFFVAPVALGKGKTLFKDVAQWLKLTLVDVTTFKTGVVVLRYVP